MMPTFYCTVLIDASVSIKIVADTPQEAAEAAMTDERAQVTLCNQCSDDLEVGDAYRVTVYDESAMRELYDTEKGGAQ